MDKINKLSRTTQLYLRWRICEMENKNAWKKDACKKLYEKYHKTCFKKRK